MSDRVIASTVARKLVSTLALAWLVVATVLPAGTAMDRAARARGNCRVSSCGQRSDTSEFHAVAIEAPDGFDRAIVAATSALDSPVQADSETDAALPAAAFRLPWPTLPSVAVVPFSPMPSPAAMHRMASSRAPPFLS